jgi:hypothetical protein
MRHAAKATPQKLSSDSLRLMNFSRAILQSGSRLEQRTWERHLENLLNKLLKGNHQQTLDAALDHLFTTEQDAYEVLMDSAEASSESCVLEQDGVVYDALLIALPVLAWTRYSIPAGTIPADILSALSAHLHAHVLAADVKLALAPTLFAIDQLPRTHADVFALTHRMGQAALKNTAVAALSKPPETVPFLADTRYLLAVITAPAGQPLCNWQAAAGQADYLGARAASLSQWQLQAAPNLMRFLPGCGVELLLPDAYYVACREADKQIRPASIRAADFYLTSTLGIESNELHASIGAFAEADSGNIDEYRIGFGIGQEPEIVYGVVWPLYGEEDDETLTESALAAAPAGTPERKTPLEQILVLLRECGIIRIKHHRDRFPIEFCEDCGVPLYADQNGELVHPEMPEGAPTGSEHFH